MAASPLRTVRRLDEQCGRHSSVSHGSHASRDVSGRRRPSTDLLPSSPLRQSQQALQAPRARSDAEARNITVAVRVRPFVERELKEAGPRSQPWALEGPGGCSVRELRTGDTYCFDHVFGPQESTSQIFEVCAREVVRSACDGINGTIFAYGQTSSGKTFTMTGGGGELGIIQSAVSELFDMISARTSGQQCTAYVVMVSYLEIYNEQVVDLLDPGLGDVKVMEDTDRQLRLTPLRQPRARSAEEVLEILAAGEEHRHVGQTRMNERSSRSHAILQLTLESSTGRDDGVRTSQLNLVDLAGSEGARHTGSVGERRREGSNINKSLLALSQVINALSGDSRQSRQHINFRDSKLTRILQPSLGGNAQTVVICAVSPAVCNVSETKSTLQFATSAGRVQNRIKVNVSSGEQSVIRALQLEMESLRSELEIRHSVGPVPEDGVTEHLEAQLREQNVGLRSETERLEARLTELEAALITSRPSPSKVRRRHTLSGRLSASPAKAISSWGTPVKGVSSPAKSIRLRRSTSGSDLAVDFVVAAQEARAAIAKYGARRRSAEEAILKLESAGNITELSTDEGSDDSPGSSIESLPEVATEAGLTRTDINMLDAEGCCPSEGELGREHDVLDELKPLSDCLLCRLRTLTGHAGRPHDTRQVLHTLEEAVELADALAERPCLTRAESPPATPLPVKTHSLPPSPSRASCLRTHEVLNPSLLKVDVADKPLPEPPENADLVSNSHQSPSDIREMLAYKSEQQLEAKVEIWTPCHEVEQLDLHCNHGERALDSSENLIDEKAHPVSTDKDKFCADDETVKKEKEKEEEEEEEEDGRSLPERLRSAESELEILHNELRVFELDRATFEKRKAAAAEDLREKHLDLHCQQAKRDCAAAELSRATSSVGAVQQRRSELQSEVAVLRAQREQATEPASISMPAALVGSDVGAEIDHRVDVSLDPQCGGAVAREAVARLKEQVAEQKAECTRAHVECDRLKFGLRRLRLENEDLEARIKESGRQPESQPQPQAEQQESLVALERRLKAEDARHERALQKLDDALRAREHLREDVEDGRARAGHAVALAVEAAEARAAAERLEQRLATARTTGQKQRRRVAHEPLADVSNVADPAACR